MVEACAKMVRVAVALSNGGKHGCLFTKDRAGRENLTAALCSLLGVSKVIDPMVRAEDREDMDAFRFFSCFVEFDQLSKSEATGLKGDQVSLLAQKASVVNVVKGVKAAFKGFKYGANDRRVYHDTEILTASICEEENFRELPHFNKRGRVEASYISSAKPKGFGVTLFFQSCGRLAVTEMSCAKFVGEVVSIALYSEIFPRPTASIDWSISSKSVRVRYSDVFPDGHTDKVTGSQGFMVDLFVSLDGAPSEMDRNKAVGMLCLPTCLSLPSALRVGKDGFLEATEPMEKWESQPLQIWGAERVCDQPASVYAILQDGPVNRKFLVLGGASGIEAVSDGLENEKSTFTQFPFRSRPVATRPLANTTRAKKSADLTIKEVAPCSPGIFGLPQDKEPRETGTLSSHADESPAETLDASSFEGRSSAQPMEEDEDDVDHSDSHFRRATKSQKASSLDNIFEGPH